MGGTKFMSNKMVLLNLAMLLCLFCAAKSEPPDAEEEELIVPRDGKTGNLDEWIHSTNLDYNIYDQCCDRPEHKDVIGAHQLEFQCIGPHRAGANCDGASLLICYPSMLDPNATIYPEKDGKPPELRADGYAQKAIDSENQITKDCEQLQKLCVRKEQDCTMPKNAVKAGEIWHGMLIRYERSAFIIELPFGTNKTSKNIRIPRRYKSENRDSFTLYLSNEKAEETGTLPQGRDEYDRDAEREAVEQERKYAMRMPLSFNNHLDSLGIDILPPESNYHIRFYTQGRPRHINESVCKRNKEGDGLVPGIAAALQYIQAKFMMKPPSPEPPPDKGVYPRGSAKDSGAAQNLKIVKVDEMKGHAQQLSIPIGASKIYVEGRIGRKAEKIWIELVHGLKDPTANLGESVLAIHAVFSNETDRPSDYHPKICEVHFLPSQNQTLETCEEKAKNDRMSMGFRRGEPFLIWISVQDGNLVVSVNCLQFEFPWEHVRYSKENYIKFKGDIELIVPPAQIVEEKVVEENRLSDAKLNEEMSSLIVQPIQRQGFSDGILRINANFHENMEELIIEFFDQQMKEIPSKINIKKVNSNLHCMIGEEECKCLQITAEQEDETKTVHGFTKSCPGTQLDLILHRLLENFNIFLDGKTVLEEIPNNMGNRSIKYIQTKGDIDWPIETFVLIPNSYSAALYGISTNKYIILYGLMIFDKRTDNKKELTLSIKMGCEWNDQPCYQREIPEDKFTFTFEINMRTNKTEVNSYYQAADSRRTFVGGNDTLASNFPFALGKPFWIKFLFNFNEKKYQIFVDGSIEALLSVAMEPEGGTISPARNEFPLDAIEVDTRFKVFNMLTVFPYQYSLSQLQENAIIRITGRQLDNANLFEFFLAQATSGSWIADLVENDRVEQEKFFAHGIVFLHIRATKTEIEHKQVCLRIMPTKLTSDSECTEGTRIANNGMDGNSHVMSIKLFKNSFKLQVDETSYSTRSTGRHSPLQATDIVIKGDITLDYKPEVVFEQ